MPRIQRYIEEIMIPWKTDTKWDDGVTLGFELLFQVPCGKPRCIFKYLEVLFLIFEKFREP